ncbi:uncharacterized protein LOC134242919, partial [Saccostrea cucullata]|uniref:uncharacterized protein LOC134242919 n=1 Tax=Saccostrea cuccullata TaxID=36930 RepID=UPI002ED1B791
MELTDPEDPDYETESDVVSENPDYEMEINGDPENPDYEMEINGDPENPDYEMESDGDSVRSEDNQEQKVSSTSDKSKHQKRRVEKSDPTTEIISSTVNVDEEVHVQHSKNKEGIRVWDKQHFCFYCQKGFTNITKHYLGVHAKEKEVQQIESHPLNSNNRKLALLKLRNSGDYQHNCAVLKTGHGTLVTFTRNWNEASAKQFLPCQYCLGFFLKSCLWRHIKNCPFAPEEKEQKYRKVSSQASLLLPTSTEVSHGLRENVLNRMSADEVSIAARNDTIIVKIGEKLYQKHGHLTHLYTHVSQKMRELGRLLISLREIDEDINSLDDAIQPQKFPTVVKCTKTLCGFKDSTNSYANPSLALKLGHSLKKCAKIKKSMALIEGSEELSKNADAFSTLCENEWTDSISSCALQTLMANKVNKGQGLPLTEDIQKLQSLLKEKTEKLVVLLQKSVTKSVWDDLNQVTLARLVMFNRRRGGEAERITVQAFCEKRSKNDSLKEIEDSLKPLERLLCKTFSRVEIRGKRGRTVPILLTPALERSINLLIETRKLAGVNPKNVYVFARSSFDSLNPIRSSDCLRKFALECGVTKAANITSTKLRKHVATVSQILNLEKNDLEIMAGFLGHDIRIHNSFYRLPNDTLQIARMGTILTAFDNGDISKYSGKSLDEIACEDINLDGDVDDDDDDDEVEDDDYNAEESEAVREKEMEPKAPKPSR